MQFETRSKQRVLEDLSAKLGELPRNHPERGALTRMIEGLKGELRAGERREIAGGGGSNDPKVFK
jgi:hypothetical protein